MIPKNPILRAVALATLLSAPVAANAHDSYIQLRFGDWTLVNAHGAEADDSYPPERVANVSAHRSDGSNATITAVPKTDYTALAPAKEAATIAATYVSGFWTKDTSGKWHNRPKSEVENPEKSGEYQRHAVAVIAKADTFKPFGLPLEIIPASNPLNMHPGDLLTVTVLANGVPLTEAEIGSALPNITPVKTGSDGKAQITIREGHNILLVAHTKPHPNQAKADKQTHEATLSFVPHSEHDH